MDKGCSNLIADYAGKFNDDICVDGSCCLNNSDCRIEYILQFLLLTY